MVKNDPLFSLIRSLSKSEKRYFKIYTDLQEGDKAYRALYEIIEKEDCDSGTLKDLFSKKFPKTAFEPAKKHLYKTLMKSLRSYEAGNSVENKLLDSIKDIRILFNKGITELCFDEIEKSKKLALKYEKFSFYMILSRIELQYQTKLGFTDINEESLIAKQEKINQVLNYEIFQHRHSSLYEILLWRYFKNGITRSSEEKEQLNDLLLEEFQITSNEHYSSFESTQLHLHFQSIYFLLTGNHEESLKTFYELNQLFEQNLSLWEDGPIYYVYLIRGILTDLRLMKKHGDMRYFLHALSKIETRSENLRISIEHIILQNEIIMLSDMGMFKKALVFVNEYENKFKSKSFHLPLNESYLMKFYIGVVYFGLNNFKLSLKYVNEILNSGEIYVSSEVYTCSRLLNMFIHLELDNHEYFNYEIRSFERKLKKKKKLYDIEKATLSFFKKWVSKPNLRDTFKLFYQDLIKISENNYENRLLEVFDFIPWINSKIKNISFEEAILLRIKEKSGR